MTTTELIGLKLQKSLLPIDIVTYNLYSEEWWKGKIGLLTKTYESLIGGVIEKGSWVEIQFPMQKKRFHYYIHHGAFYVRDLNGIEIGGIECEHLLLLDTELFGDFKLMKN